MVPRVATAGELKSPPPRPSGRGSGGTQLSVVGFAVLEVMPKVGPREEISGMT